MIKITNSTIKRKDFFLEIDNLEIKENKVYAIIGKNAAGKSSLLYALTGALYTDLVWKEDLKIAYVANDWPFTEHEYISKIADHMVLLDPSFDKDKFWLLLEKFKINYFNNKKVLSTGDQKMVQLAIALVRNPDLLILDEFLLNIDQYRKEEFKSILSDFMSQANKSIVIATNQLDAFEDIVDNLIYLKNNRIFYNGSLLKLKENFYIKRMAKEEISHEDNIANLIENEYYTEALIREKNNFNSNILSIIKHLERTDDEEIIL